jgi:ferric-dicitrate binding protein FerR (iron transport regulator)
MSEPVAGGLTATELHELNHLAGALREGVITDAEMARLDRLLSESPAAMDAFAELIAILAELREHRAEAGLRTASSPVPATRRGEWSVAFWSLGLAACLGLITTVAWLLWASPRPTGKIVASVIRSSGAKFELDGRPFAPPTAGSELGVGRYALLTGIVEVELAQGARVIMEAPARFELSSANKVTLLSGNLSARVLESAVGFRVETPTATVIDLGTEFGVSATAAGSEIHVFKGEVLVQTPGEPDTLRLPANRASRTDANSSVPRGIEFKPELFLRTFEVESPEYGRQVQALAPVLYLPMDLPADGINLASLGSTPRPARLEVGRSVELPYSAGRIGPALRFGGPASRTHAAAEIPLAREAQLTVCAWVWAESRPRWASIAKQWAKDFGLNRGGQFHFGLWHDNGDLEAHVHDAEGNEVIVRESEPLPLQRWHFVAFTLDGQTLRLFRNGAEVASAPCVGLAASGPTILGIGVKLDAEGRPTFGDNAGFWDGRIDELAVFHRALSPEDIRRLYASAP